MVIIFPGASTHVQSTGAATTWHIRCIASVLLDWGVTDGKLDPKCREMIELLLTTTFASPLVRSNGGTLRRRDLAEAMIS